MAYFPRADAIQTRPRTQLPVERPQSIHPILDPQNASRPAIPWTSSFQDANYPARSDEYAPATIPPEPDSSQDAYLHPVLARNERLRLTMLWYYTRDLLKDEELLSRLQERVQAAQLAVDWAEFAIIGLLDHNAYTRLATMNLPLAMLPRRESTCSHTINQPPRAAFILPNMMEDWRFKDSPHVQIGGLRAYAGVPLSLETEFGDTVNLGSLCVASNTASQGLTRQQQIDLTQLADWVVADLTQSAKARRQLERHKMIELISQVKDQVRETDSEQPILLALKDTFGGCRINIQACHTLQIVVEGRAAIHYSSFQSGLWENDVLVDRFLESENHDDPVIAEAIRVIAVRCENTSIPTFLTVTTHDYRRIFDDVDSWFVQSCASMLSRIWQARLLKEAMRAKEKFLRGITHQLRTPIHGILGSADLLREEFESQRSNGSPINSFAGFAPLTPTKSLDAAIGPLTYINTIRSSARDLISTVNSMLTLNRWEDVAKAERVDTLHTLDELETGLSGEISKALSGDARYKTFLLLHSEYSKSGDSIYIDIRLLTDCLLPIVLNAVQSAPEGAVVVCLSNRSGTNDLVVDIHDNGCGIATEYHSRIWEAHEKIDSHSTGAGLGLTLAAKFATLLNGSIELISSQINHGSHFRAVFQDVTFACSLSSAAAKSSVTSVPSRKFRRLDTGAPPSFICQHLLDFLQGFEYDQEQNIGRTILLLDNCPDAVQRSTILSTIPFDQPVVYLVGNSDDYNEAVDERHNLISIRSPCLSSTLRQALIRADATTVPRKSAPITIPIPAKIQGSNLNISPPTPTFKRRRYSTEEYNFRGTESARGRSVPAKSLSNAQSVLVVSVDSLQLAGQAGPGSSSKAVRSSTLPNTLIVDDNAVNLRIMQMYCNKRRLPQCTAIDGQKAVELYVQLRAADASAIELILMDLQMPVMDGIQATKSIRQLEKEKDWPRSVIFIITGQDSQSDRLDAEIAGANGYYVKPASIKMLDHGIKDWFPGFSPP